MLKEQGIECARRTVAKYREALRIAPGQPEKSLVNQLQLFLPCAAGVEGFLADEVHRLTGLAGDDLLTGRGGVMLRASWRDAMRLNLHSRLAQRVLVQLSHTPYRSENDLYEAASAVAWEIWFTTKRELQGRGDGAAQPAEKPELRRAQDQGRRCRSLSQQGRRAAQRRYPVARHPHLRPPHQRHRDALHRYLGRAAVQARLARGQGRGAAEGNAGRRHDRRQRLGRDDAAVRPLLRQRHHRDRGRPGGLQYRAGPAAPLRLRKDAALPGPCVEGAVGRGQGPAAAGERAGVRQRRGLSHGRLRHAQRGPRRCSRRRAAARRRRLAAYAAQRGARCDAGQSAVWRAHRDRRRRRPQPGRA